MATIEEMLNSHLLGDTALAALVGNRIFPDSAPQNTAVPFLRYTLIDRSEVLVKPNVAALRLVNVRIQLDIFAASYASVKAIQRALTSALYGFDAGVDSSLVTSRISDVRDMSDTNEREFRVSMDASITFNE